MHNNNEQPRDKNLPLVITAHIVCWICFLSIPAFFNPRLFGKGPLSLIQDIFEPPRLINAAYLVILFYANTYFTIPHLYFRHKYVPWLLTIMASILVFALINNSMAPPPQRSFGGPGGPPHFPSMVSSFHLFMLIIVYAFSFITCLYRQYHKIKEDGLNTRISFLTAQVNPHFLFNTLNSIHSLALQKSDKTSDAIVMLSGIMRYSFNEGSWEKAELSKELNYITGYLALQQLRITDEVTVKITINNQQTGQTIVPFLLIPFVENAFKYGTNGEDPSEIEIVISADNNKLHLLVVNDIVPTRDRGHSTGIGIKTTRQRLHMLYPDHHKLEITTSDNKFTVQLHLDL